MLAGQFLAKGLEKVYEGVDATKFTPHSIHSVFTGGSADGEWGIDTISSGKNFINKAAHYGVGGTFQVAINCSLTSRNSYEFQRQKYLAYKQLIEERRAKGLTEDDDDEDDIQAVENPLNLQPPFPELTDLASAETKTVSDIEYKLVQATTIDLHKNSTIVYLCKLNSLQSPNKFVEFLKLTDSIEVLHFPREKTPIEERVVYFHDSAFEMLDFTVFQVRVVSYTRGRLLLEAEAFSLHGVHFATVHQLFVLLPSRL